MAFGGRIVSGKKLNADDFKYNEGNNGKRPKYIAKTDFTDTDGMKASTVSGLSDPNKVGAEQLSQSEEADSFGGKGKEKTFNVYKKHLGGLFYTRDKKEVYEAALEFFVENGVVLNESQLDALQESFLNENSTDTVAKSTNNLIGAAVDTAKRIHDVNKNAQDFRNIQAQSGHPNQVTSKLGLAGKLIDNVRYKNLQNQTQQNAMANQYAQNHQ